MVPVAFIQALIVTLSLSSFLPSAECSKEAASVLSSNRRKLRKSCFITIEKLIESKLVLFNKFIERCD